MRESELLKIRDIKLRVKAMLDERQSLQSRDDGEVVNPSAYWSDFCSYFDYMLGLEEQYYAKVRLHTYHLTTDNYQFYYFAETGVLGGSETFRRNIALEQLSEGLPPTYILNEPDGGIGFRYDDGRFVSIDIARYQRVVASLYRHHVLSSLPHSENRRASLLEIGGGYGGLAHHLSRIAERSTYVIVDLPETLLFSAAYLMLLNPEKKIYLYGADDFQEVVENDDWGGYDFILIPNYRLRALEGRKFDFVLNMTSLQEMRVKQAEEYLDFIRAHCAGVFYSWNEDRHQPHNAEMTNLSELLRRRFKLLDITEENLLMNPPSNGDIAPEPRRLKVLRKIGRAIGLLPKLPDAEKTKIYPLYTFDRNKEYLCTPLPEEVSTVTGGA